MRSVRLAVEATRVLVQYTRMVHSVLSTEYGPPYTVYSLLYEDPPRGSALHFSVLSLVLVRILVQCVLVRPYKECCYAARYLHGWM